MTESLEAAKSYLDLGWQPVAAPPRGKAPRGSWKRWQSERVTQRDVDDSFSRPANVFLITGRVGGLTVLDCDNQEALDYWRERLGSVIDETACVQTGNGWHFYFELEDDGKVYRGRSSSGDTGSGKWDLRAEGGGVVAPPSIHPSGRVYEWTRGPECIQAAPAALWESDPDTGDGVETRSLLTHLLQNPPTSGGRNTWLSRVAGHYAKYIPHRDAFDAMIDQTNQNLAEPLPQDEVEKLKNSIWSSESSKGVPDVDASSSWREALKRPTPENGYLVSASTRILTQVRTGSGEDAEYGLRDFMDADIRVIGVIVRDEDEDRKDMIYSVELRYPDGSFREDYLATSVVSDYRKLTSWLAARGVTFSLPDSASPRRPGECVRIMRYLKAQDALPMRAAEGLGWDMESSAFVTHDGIIRANGLATFENVRPEPDLKKWAPYRYGMSSDEEARQVLAEIMTFHHEDTAAVFGAWWAAVLLKPQIAERTSQFPFMAIEAPSESGKTKGFFPLMIQLSGNRAGQINPTRAALRDYLSAHNNGVIWVDDLDSLDELGELLRQVTVGGSMVKKGADNNGQVVATMRSALVVSGESLGLRAQKALIDRAVALEVSTPMGRSSLRDPKRPQWDDIVDLMTRYPDLTDLSGNIVGLALKQESLIPDIKRLRIGSGRYADTLAIIRLGSRVLRGMLGSDATGVVERVDSWAARKAQEYTGRENALTLKILPTALSSTGWLETPLPPDSSHRQVASPCFISRDGMVWFSPKLLAQWWVREPKRGRVVDRTESEEALADQARDLGLGGVKGVDRKSVKLAGTQTKYNYWRCSREISDLVLRRSRGTEDGEDDDE